MHIVIQNNLETLRQHISTVTSTILNSSMFYIEVSVVFRIANCTVEALVRNFEKFFIFFNFLNHNVP